MSPMKWPKPLIAICSLILPGGNRHGVPKGRVVVGFHLYSGRARSHTKATPTWETWRLVGTLDGHLGAYRHRDLPAAVTTAAPRRDSAGGHLDPFPTHCHGGTSAPRPPDRGGTTAARWRWCSPACPAGTW